MKTQDIEIVRRSSAFRFLSDEHFGALEPLLQEERYDFGELIVKQGEPASAFYILISGRARVVKAGANNGEGHDLRNHRRAHGPAGARINTVLTCGPR